MGHDRDWQELLRSRQESRLVMGSGVVTYAKRIFIWERDKGLCWLCGFAVKLEDMSLEIRNSNRILANLMLQDEINQSSLTGLQFDNLVLLRKYIMHQAVHLSQEYLMSLLEFCCRHQIQVHQMWQDDETTKEDELTSSHP